jgi:putative transposase
LILTYKYKIYENKRNKNLNNLINISSKIYNHCIALHNRFYKLYKKSLHKYQLSKHLTKLKKLEKHSYWNLLGSQVIQEITERIDKGYKKFFDYKKGKTRLKAGKPTFKKMKKYKSFTFKGKVGYKIDKNRIIINKKSYKFSLSRPIDGKIKTVTVKRDNLGDFYIAVAIEVKNSKNRNARAGKSVGIDFGLKQFLTLSNGEKIDSPLYLLKNINNIRKLNRSHSRKNKNSNNREKARIKLAKLHQKIANQRKDYFHKLSNKLAENYENIFIEDLNLKAMQKMWGRKVNDLAFSEFILILSYKTNTHKIDRFYPSSKTCSKCENIKEDLELKDRVYECKKCGNKIDRDLNASINIHRVGAKTLGVGNVKPDN